MKRAIIEFTDEEFALFQQAERKNELVAIKELIQKMQNQGRVNLAEV